jgi:hypothetical protein
MALPQHIRQMATDAVSQDETTRQIRLVSVNHIDAPLLTPKVTRQVGGCPLLEYLWGTNSAEAHREGMERDDGR